MNDNTNKMIKTLHVAKQALVNDGCKYESEIKDLQYIEELLINFENDKSNEFYYYELCELRKLVELRNTGAATTNIIIDALAYINSKWGRDEIVAAVEFIKKHHSDGGAIGIEVGDEIHVYAMAYGSLLEWKQLGSHRLVCASVMNLKGQNIDPERIYEWIKSDLLAKLKVHKVEMIEVGPQR